MIERTISENSQEEKKEITETATIDIKNKRSYKFQTSSAPNNALTSLGFDVSFASTSLVISCNVALHSGPADSPTCRRTIKSRIH